MQYVPQIRVFLASPGDVNEERAVALEVLDRLEYDPLFRTGSAGGVSIHPVAWDKPGGDTPMRATMTPQTAIQQGLPRPLAEVLPLWEGSPFSGLGPLTRKIRRSSSGAGWRRATWSNGSKPAASPR